MDEVVCSVFIVDRLIILGDFNVRIGLNYIVWMGIIGYYGIG